ncbi:MAG: putative sensor protein [Frankiales bacterium]|nr:putative sensor protein [Frankiales bacterium]
MSGRPLDETVIARAAGESSDPSLQHERLPRVLHDSPVAVLLVDLGSGCVVQANPAGRALTDAPPSLPQSVAQWSADADLRRPSTTGFAVDDGPVERIVSGEVVHGEPVLVGGQLRWVTGFPIPGEDGDDRAQALVVFFDLDGSGHDVEVRDRAVVAAGLSFTISDPRRPDNPLVFVNPAFERTTGWSRAEVVGRNCRFLQGPATDPDAVQRVRDALRDEQHATITLLNHRKDGTAFWNELSLSPVYDASGELTHFVGIQADVTSRIHVEREREQHLEAERAARAAAERAQRQLALLAEATSLLAATLDVDESLDRLTGLAVPLMADWCTVHLVGDDGRVQRVAARHRDPDLLPLLRRLEELQPTGLTDDSHTATVLRGGPPVLVEVDDDVLVQGIDDPELLEVYRQIGMRSVIVVPLRARRQVVGVLALYTDGSGRTFGEDDLATAADLARRAALAVDNARLYQREHDVAEQLQRSLLPQLPQVAGLDRAARYLPGSTAAQVGGDWYDLFALPDGTVGIAIGDVMGHDLAAAASMGQLRSVLQSYAWQGSSPAVVLDRLDQLVQGLAMAQLATCVYGRLDLPSPDGPGRLRLSNAGHLPPALRSPDGSVRLIGGPPSLLVGAALGTSREEVEEQLDPGSTLVLYTDGLVEHRGRGIDEGLAALQAAVASAPDADADAICEHLLSQLADGALEDDVAVLVVRVL